MHIFEDEAHIIARAKLRERGMTSEQARERLLTARIIAGAYLRYSFQASKGVRVIEELPLFGDDVIGVDHGT